MIRLALSSHNRLLRRIGSSITYTRQYFEDLNIDRQSIQKNRQLEQIKQHKQNVWQIVSNDKNSQKHLKTLKVDGEVFKHIHYVQTKNQVDECAIIVPEPRKQPVLISATRKYILTTMKKATLAMKYIRKKYLYDAIVLLENSQKKVSKLMIKTLYSIARHAMDKKLDPFRLYVHGVIVGKTRRFKGVRYHAKGKGGRQVKTLCQIKIIAQQRDQQQFWQEVGTGHAPSAFASIVRTRLVETNANYDQLIKLGGITTAKGRQQKREILKRRVAARLNENKSNQVYVPKKLIEKQIKEQEGVRAKELFKDILMKDTYSETKNREILFKKNMGIK